MGVQVIPIPTEVVSHSLPLPFPILCFIPIPIGFPVPLGIPFPCTSLLESGVRVTCDVGYLCANFSLPRPLCSRFRVDVHDRQTSDRQTDVRRALSLNASALWGGRITQKADTFPVIATSQMYRLWKWLFMALPETSVHIWYDDQKLKILRKSLPFHRPT